MASLLGKGEAQDAEVPRGIRVKARAVSLGKENRQSPGVGDTWLEIERLEGSVTLSRDRWFGTETVFMLSGAIIRGEAKEPCRARRQSVRSSEEAG